MYEDLFKKPNVNLVGYGYRYSKGEIVGEGVVVGVKRKIPPAALATQEIIPLLWNGLRTDVLEVGEIVAPRPLYLQSGEPTDRWRPALPGVSIGHYQITAGTFGCVVYDDIGTKLILSNNHVLANSNKGGIGDAILQPGAYDGGTVYNDLIARLYRFQPIDFGTAPPTCPVSQNIAKGLNVLAKSLGSNHRLSAFQESLQAVNRIDAAVAIPELDSDILDEILEIGKPEGTTDVTLGTAIEKSGRTTGHTTGQVLVIGATVQVSYGPEGTATFEDQIVSGPMSAGGDSGSLGIVKSDGRILAFGLLFAGSEQVTIYNPIEDVFDLLNVRF